MATRKVTEPRIIESPMKAPVPDPDDAQLVYLYLTDSSEINRVRSPLPKGSTAELRCAFTSRELTLPERQTFRNAGTLPDGAGVTPVSVLCSVSSPLEEVFLPKVAERSPGVFWAYVDLFRVGIWEYGFTGEGIYAASDKRKLEVQKAE